MADEQLRATATLEDQFMPTLKRLGAELDNFSRKQVVMTLPRPRFFYYSAGSLGEVHQQDCFVLPLE